MVEMHRKNLLHRTVVSVQATVWYAATMALLALVSVLLLVYELLPVSHSEIIILFQEIDIVIAYIFLIDFVVGLLFPAETRRTYVAHNWINVLASIPLTSDVTRALRILRLVRAYRVIRAAVDVWQLTARYKKSRSYRT